MKTLRSVHFWAILGLFLLITLLHYAEQIGMPLTAEPSSHFGLTRHSLDRILFIIPVIYTSFIFGQRAGLIVSGVALAIMLPRALWLSPALGDAVLETLGVAFTAVLACMWVSLRTRQKEHYRKTLAELESAHQLLQRYVRSARDNERRLTMLNTISTVLTESLDLGAILHKAIHLIMELMDVEVVLIFSLDNDGQNLTLVAHGGVTEQFARFIGKVKVGQGLYGKAARLTQPLTLEDGAGDDYLTDTPEFKKMKIKSQLVVPLMLRERIRGVVCVAMRRPRRFLTEEIDLLGGVTTQMAAALENSRLYESERATAQKLAVSEQNYRELFEKANDAIWVHDFAGKITFANKAAANLMGYTVEELLQINARDFLWDSGRSLAARIRRDLLDNRPVVQPYEQHLRKKDGSEVVLMLTTSLVTEDGKHIAFHHIARDVTEEKRMQDNLRYYLSQITKVQEEERKRIARELHDETSQALYALSRQLDNYLRANSEISADHASFLKDLRDKLNYAQEGVRRFSQALRPPMLDDLGLVPTVRWLIDDMHRFMETRIQLKTRGSERRLSPEAELTLFRAIQEALRNVWKHSQAEKAEIIMDFHKDLIKVTIADNGIGFVLPEKMESVLRTGKLGLAGIEERIRLLGGNLKLHSEPGKGTSLVIETPV